MPISRKTIQEQIKLLEEVDLHDYNISIKTYANATMQYTSNASQLAGWYVEIYLKEFQ